MNQLTFSNGRAFAELERRAKAKDVAHDHILLETTGLADPSPLAFTFFANPWIAARFSLDSIICVVDAKYLMQVRNVSRMRKHTHTHTHSNTHTHTLTHLYMCTLQHLFESKSEGEVNEAVQQIAFADLILLNKIYLVDEETKVCQKKMHIHSHAIVRLHPWYSA